MSAKTAFIFLGSAALGAGGMYAWVKRATIKNWFVKRAAATAVQQAVHDSLFGQGLTALPEGADPAIAIRQIRRYAFAAAQDQSPIVGLTHASYALVLLDTLEEMIGRDAARTLSGVDPARLRLFITQLQDAHAKKLQGCDPYMQQILALEQREGRAIPGFVIAGAGAAPMGA